MATRSKEFLLLKDLMEHTNRSSDIDELLKRAKSSLQKFFSTKKVDIIIPDELSDKENFMASIPDIGGCEVLRKEFPELFTGSGECSPSLKGKCHFCIPLVSSSEKLGVIHIGIPGGGKGTSYDPTLLKDIGEQLANAVHRIRSDRQIKTLYDVNKTISSTLDLENVMDIAIREVLKIVKAPLSSTTISLVDEASGKLKIAASRGIRRKDISSYEVSIKDIPPGLVHRMMKEKKPFFMPDIAKAPSIKKFLLSPGLKAFYIWPLQVGEKVIGIFTLASTARNALSPEELEMVTSLSQQVAVAIDNARLYRASQRKAFELSALHDMVTTIISSHDLDERLNIIARLSTVLLEQEFCGIAIMEAGKYLDLKANHGLKDQFLKNWNPGKYSFVLERVIRDGHIYNSSHDEEGLLAKDPLFRKAGVQTLAAFPLQVKDKILGVLFMGRYDYYQYLKDELGMMGLLSNHTSLAIENAMLYANALMEKDKTRSIVENMGDGVLTLDWERRITSFNEAAELITGWKAQEVMGRTCDEIFRGKSKLGESKCDTACPLVEILKSPASMDRGLKAEGIILTKSGEEKFVSSTHSILSFENDLLGGIIVFRDITKEKQQEQMKADFIASVSHDLRTPLTSVKNYVLALLRHGSKLTEEERNEFFRVINSEIDRLNRLLDNMINLSKMDSGMLRPRKRTFDVRPYIKKVMNLYKVNSSKHKFVEEIPEELPSVKGDSDYFEQILNNLLSNAVKYSSTGGEIKTVCQKFDNELEISVLDEGIGIDRSDVEKIFNRYQRLEDKISEKVSGTGLGLYISKILVEALGGRIWLESASGRGSKFSFTLPLTHN